MAHPMRDAFRSAWKRIPYSPLRSIKYKKIRVNRFDPGEMSCHIWALAGNPNTARTLARQYENQSNMLGMPYLMNQGTLPIPQARTQIMQTLAGLAEPRTQQLGHEVYICGGFGPGAVCPEHLWLEDRTTGWTYDTMPGIPDIIKVHRVGVDGADFQPGCEGNPMRAHRIRRVRVDGYTVCQLNLLPHAKLPNEAF